MKAAADSGYFADRTWLHAARRGVRRTCTSTRWTTWNAGRTAEVPKAWRIALTASDDRSMTGLGDFMLNMNAHINNDFPHALATVGLTAADGTSHKPDHNAYNQRLDSLYIPVFEEEAERFDPTFDDFDVGPLDDTGRRRDHARLARDGLAPRGEARRRAKTPAQRQLAEHAIEEYAASQAAVIRQMFASPTGPPPATPIAPSGTEPHWGVFSGTRPALSVVEVSASTERSSMFLRTKSSIPAPAEALPGRAERRFPLAEKHKALDAPLVTDEVPEGYEVAVFGLGCFWGAEEIFWQVPGVWSTSVGYAGGTTPHPSYEEVCSGRTGHTEAVRVVYDPAKVSYADLVATFYEVHDPTQGMRQGNDMGTQYRSAIYYSTPEQERSPSEVTERYQPELTKRGYGADHHRDQARQRDSYYYAEDHHQQYLLKNPFGYRCHSATGITVPR